MHKKKPRLGFSQNRKLGWSTHYLHKNSEKKNSDADLQRQLSHVFPAVWRRHVHDSEINPSNETKRIKDKTGGQISSGRGGGGSSLLLIHLNKKKRALPDAVLPNRTCRAPPSRLGHLKQPFVSSSPVSNDLLQSPRAIFFSSSSSSSSCNSINDSCSSIE